jgi:L-lactate dehydrogenase complex protein LldG
VDGLARRSRFRTENFSRNLEGKAVKRLKLTLRLCASAGKFVPAKALKALRKNKVSNSEAKRAIFDSIRQNLAASLPYDELHKAHHKHEITGFDESFSPQLSLAALIENFRSSFEFVGGKFTHVYDETEAAEILLSIIKEKSARKIALTNSALVKKTVGFLKMDVEFIENADAGTLFECDLGVTGAQFGIAETGTLVLESEKESNRLTSLVPPVHICLLEAADIRQTLGEILRELEENLSKTVTFITGASRTSDIELTLAVGVHGPGELHLILIEKQEALSTDSHR